MYIPLDNKIIGQNIAKLRQHKGVKAFEVAKQLNISEAAYTKYERGETAITINFINAVAKFFDVAPIHFLEHKPENIVENIHNSNLAFQTNSTFNTVDKELLKTITAQLVIKDKQIFELVKKLK